MNKLPIGFEERLHKLWTTEVVSSFIHSFNERPPTIRINTIKASTEEQTGLLKEAGFLLKEVPWYKDAFIVTNKSKREITEIASYNEGKIYIQSLASMVPPLALEPLPGDRVLDLTAAPGSKTSQIAALMSNQGEVLANDNSRERFFRLKKNLEHLGVANSTLNLTLRLEHGARIGREFPNYFDKVLLDAPCSAEARFIENNPKTFGFWKEKKLSEIAKRQRSLIVAALNALRPGGTMVYSTCTLSPEENELQIDWLLRKLGQNIIVESIPGKLLGLPRLPNILSWKDKELNKSVKESFRLLPTSEIEGFFITRIKKLGVVEPPADEHI